MQAHQLREMSYMQAVHETGARLTHDVKNLLQSLHTLCAASTQTGSESSAGFQALMQRQLPAITQRLQQTLNKLQQPVESSTQPLCPAEPWWTAMRQRYEENGVTMHAHSDALHKLIPGSLFDSALENLLQNAFDKRALDSQLKISASLRDSAGQVVLEVEDDGVAIDTQIATGLGWSLANSENGLGIGLYQVSKQANMLGYELGLRSNRDGAVCFCLSPIQREMPTSV
jgi:signal transduction histidine kinase